MTPVPRSVWAALAATVSAGGLIVIAEIDRLIAAAGSPAYPSAALYGPLHGPAQDAAVLGAWSGALGGTDPLLRDWLYEQLGADVVFVLGYTALLLVIDARFGLRLRPLVIGLAAADLVEDLIALLVFAPTGGPHPGLTASGLIVQVLAAASALKWIAVVLLLAGAAFRLWQRHLLGATPSAGLVRAVFHQRFSVIVVALLAVMTIVPSGGVLDQAPDILRRMLPDALWSAEWGRIAATVACAGILCGTLLYLGAVRAYGVLDENSGPGPVVDPIANRANSTGRWWVVGAAISSAVLLVLMLLGVVAWSGWAYVLPAAAFGVGAVSLVLLALKVPALASRSPFTNPVSSFAVTRQIGRLLAYSVPVIALLAMARAVTAQLALGGGPVVIAFVPVVAAALVWLVLAERLSAGGPLQQQSAGAGLLHPKVAGRTGGSPGLLVGGSQRPALLVSVALFIGVSAALITAPLWWGGVLGVLGVMLVSFTGLAALFAAVSIWIQRVTPPPLFRTIGLRRTPVITLLVLVGVLTNAVAASSPHDVAVPGSSANAAAIARWRGARWIDLVERRLDPDTGSANSTAAGCGRVGTGGTTVTARPMIFIALEGGGMRAAYWAAGFLKRVLAHPCLAADVVAVSGVSGGSVGLATVDAAGGDALSAVSAMSGQDGLGAVVDALLTRDLLSGSYGVDVTGPHEPYLDRAALLTAAWERQARSAGAGPALASPYPLVPPPPGTAAKVPWVSVFNSTSGLTGCVVTVSDADLGIAAAKGRTCPGGSLPGSYQLFAAEPRYAGLPLVQAAMLSARFPIISPSAVIRTEDGWVADQLIDGGYADNSGLATVDRLLSAAMPSIRAHNAASVASKNPEVVVPVVISLSNDPAALAKDPKPLKPGDELTLPMWSRLRAGAALVTPAALRAQAAGTAWGFLPSGLDSDREVQVRRAVAGSVQLQVIALAPAAQPGVAVPLGWALSSATMGTMDRALTCITGEPALPAGRPACRTSPNTADAEAFARLVQQVDRTG